MVSSNFFSWDPDQRRSACRLFGFSFLLLFMEVGLIRFIPANVQAASYFINLVLIATFLGMGVGMVLQARGRDCLVYFAPFILLLFFQRSTGLFVGRGRSLLFKTRVGLFQCHTMGFGAGGLCFVCDDHPGIRSAGGGDRPGIRYFQTLGRLFHQYYWKPLGPGGLFSVELVFSFPIGLVFYWIPILYLVERFP